MQKKLVISILVFFILGSNYSNSATYYWDKSPTQGFQVGSGVWSTDSISWATDTTGKTLVAWPGTTGNTAIFAGITGNYTISLKDTQLVDSIVFKTNKYTLTGGGLNFSKNALLYVDSGITAIINSAIKSQTGDTLKKEGKGKLVFTGGISPSVAKINKGTLQIGNNDTSGVFPLLIYNNDTLIYYRAQKPYTYPGNIYGTLGTIIKRGDTTLTFTGNISAKTLIVDSGAVHLGQNTTTGNILSNIILNGNSVIRFNRSDTLVFAGIISGTGSVVKGGNGTLILTGNNTYTGITRISTGILQIGKDSTTGSIAGNIILDSCPLVFKRANFYNYTGNISGKGKVTQAGKGILVLSGNHNFTGELIVADSCTAFINGEVDSTVEIIVKDKATIGGKGNCKTSVTLGKAAILSPGDQNTPGKFSISTLTIDSTSFLNIQIDSLNNDTLSLTKNTSHSISGKLNIISGEKFGAGRYRIIISAGTLLSNLSLATVPSNYNYYFVKDNNFLDLLIYEKKLRIISQPQSKSVILGDTVKFTINIGGTPPFSYQWFKKLSTKDSLISTDSLLLIRSVAFNDSGSYYCIVKDYIDSSITSNIFYLTVLPPPPSNVRLTPTGSITILQNNDIQFRVTAEGLKETFLYTWHRKQGNKDSILLSGKDTILSLGRLNVSDSGYYYCIVSNGGGSVSSDTAYLYVKPLPPVVNFTYSDTTGKAPLSVTFKDISTGVITYRLWKFGDGKTDTAAQVVHMYKDTGSFTVVLIVGGPGGVDSLVKRNLININGFKDTIIDTSSQDTLNPIRLTRLYFDSLSGLIRVGWCIESVMDIGGEDIEVGITYSLEQYSRSVSGGQVIRVSEECVDTVVRLREGVVFDSLYYVSLWYRRGGGEWLEPTERSRGTVRTGRPYREIVSFFDSSKVVDSVRVFNGRVVIWKDSSYLDRSVIRDTLEVVRIGGVEGFVVVGEGIRFRGGSRISVMAFNVGIRVDSVPKGYSIRDIRVYRVDEGGYRVEYGSVVDERGRLVYVKTSDLRGGFVLMIDTVRPRIEVMSDTSGYVLSIEGLVDSVRVEDNVRNVRWWYVYGRGEDVGEVRNSGEMRERGGVVRLEVKEGLRVISSESGFRGYFVVSDGRYVDSVNMSRVVLRERSDAQSTEGGRWRGIYSSSELKRKGIEGLVRQVCGDSGYDVRYLRIFRWVEYEGNRGKEDKWVEYDGSREEIRRLFDLEPGRLIWVKTRENRAIDLDSGYTLSLRDTFEVKLVPRGWTDFGMPYRFSVSLGDVFKSSGKGVEEVVYVYKWRRDSVSGRVYTDGYYVYGIPNKMDVSLPLRYEVGGGYSFYNRSRDTVVLRIPSYPSLVVGGKGGSGKEMEREGWYGVRLISRDGRGIEIGENYIGYSGEKEERYPVLRSLSGLRVRLYDRERGERYGGYVGVEVREGIEREIEYVNLGDSVEDVRIEVEEVGRIPEGVEVKVYEVERGEVRERERVKVLGGGGISRLWVVIGGEGYQERFKERVRRYVYRLYGIYPNPCRGLMNLRYSVPYGSEGDRIEIEVYSLRGRRVYRKEISRLREGMNVFSWDGKDRRGVEIVSGMYIVRMRVIEKETRKTIYKAQQKITWVR